jgi:hypothetical protein
LPSKLLYQPKRRAYFYFAVTSSLLIALLLPLLDLLFSSRFNFVAATSVVQQIYWYNHRCSSKTTGCQDVAAATWPVQVQAAHRCSGVTFVPGTAVAAANHIVAAD